jgi:hypothetical protein
MTTKLALGPVWPPEKGKRGTNSNPEFSSQCFLYRPTNSNAPYHIKRMTRYSCLGNPKVVLSEDAFVELHPEHQTPRNFRTLQLFKKEVHRRIEYDG